MLTILPQSVPRNDSQWRTFLKKFDGVLSDAAEDVDVDVLKNAWINVKAYGCVGDNSTDDTTNFQTALTAAANNILYVPNGIYKLSGALTLDNAGVTIIGAGQCATELRWTSGASTRGINLTPNSATQLITVRDLRLTSAGTTGTALQLDFSSQIVDIGGGVMMTMDRINSRFLVEACTISGASGDPFTDSWANGIDVIAAVGGAVRDCTICGLADTATAPVSGTGGISFYGSPQTGNFQNGHPVQFVVDNCTVWFCEAGVQFLNCEGCYVVNSNIIACAWGVYGLSETDNHPQLTVANSHMNCSVRGIQIDGMNQISIAGCLIYGIQNAANAICLEAMGGGSTGAVYGNTFVATSTNATGIAVDSYSHLAISNNSFVQVSTNMVTAIWLTSNSSNCKGAQNIYNGTFANTVLDQGTANFVT